MQHPVVCISAPPPRTLSPHPTPPHPRPLCSRVPSGGAQDAANFRENIRQGHLPVPTDVTFEGLIKDYFFDTTPDTGSAFGSASLRALVPFRLALFASHGSLRAPCCALDDGPALRPACPRAPCSDAEPCTELFCPTYSLALAPDPLLAAGAVSREEPPPPQVSTLRCRDTHNIRPNPHPLWEKTPNSLAHTAAAFKAAAWPAAIMRCRYSLCRALRTPARGPPSLPCCTVSCWRCHLLRGPPAWRPPSSLTPA